MGNHYPGGSKPKAEFKFETLDQFAVVRTYFKRNFTAKRIAERTHISLDNVERIITRLQGQRVDTILAKPRMRSLSVEEVQRNQEPIGCRAIYGDVKNDFDWFYCQKPLKVGGRYMFCDSCYPQLVRIEKKQTQPEPQS